MPKTLQIKVERMTSDTFAPFGQLIDPGDAPHNPPRSFPVDFQGGKTRISAAFLPYKGLTFSILEQHFNVTQSFLPLSGAPAIVGLAPPTDPHNPHAIPSTEDIRIFLIDGSVGYLLKKNTWHSDRLPFFAPGSRMAIITDEETSEDLRLHGAASDPPQKWGGWKLNRIVDYKSKFGVSFQAILS
ncbi:MAG: hypothetical protein FJ320_06735 [SAR202 cluster bacterium]|nr:hypothetical protein [SAR202 cluster bacterium]